MDAEAGTRFEAGTRKLTDIFFAIIPVWQVSSFSILDSSWASYQVLERGSLQEWEGEEKSGSAF